jgi:hypothetical protein
MTLATHTVVATAIASVLPGHPVIATVAAFSSHFLLDSLPHWDYRLVSQQRDFDNPMNLDFAIDRRFLHDLRHIFCDILIGVGLSVVMLLFFHSPILPALLIGVVGGVLPDALQVVYSKFRHEPLVSLQRFHQWIQKGKSLEVSPLRGILLQVAVIFIVLFLVRL